MTRTRWTWRRREEGSKLQGAKNAWENEDSELQRERSEAAHSAVRVSPEPAKFIRRRHHLFSGAFPIHRFFVLFSISHFIHHCFSFRRRNCGGRKSQRIWSWLTDTNRSFHAPAPPRRAEPAIPVTHPSLSSTKWNINKLNAQSS